MEKKLQRNPCNVPFLKKILNMLFNSIIQFYLEIHFHVALKRRMLLKIKEKKLVCNTQPF